MKLITLTVEFVNKIYAMGSRKIIKERPSGQRFVYYGYSKKECLEQAKLAGRTGSMYRKTWEIIEE
jgi:hypothetical protein